METNKEKYDGINLNAFKQANHIKKNLFYKFASHNSVEKYDVFPFPLQLRVP